MSHPLLIRKADIHNPLCGYIQNMQLFRANLQNTVYYKINEFSFLFEKRSFHTVHEKIRHATMLSVTIYSNSAK